MQPELAVTPNEVQSGECVASADGTGFPGLRKTCSRLGIGLSRPGTENHSKEDGEDSLETSN